MNNNNQQGQNNQGTSNNIFVNPFVKAQGGSNPSQGGSQTSQVSFGPSLKSGIFANQQGGDNQQKDTTASNLANTTGNTGNPPMGSNFLSGGQNKPAFGVSGGTFGTANNQSSNQGGAQQGGENTSNTKPTFGFQSNGTSNTGVFPKPQVNLTTTNPTNASNANQSGQTSNDPTNLNKGFSFSNTGNANLTTNTSTGANSNPFSTTSFNTPFNKPQADNKNEVNQGDSSKLFGALGQNKTLNLGGMSGMNQPQTTQPQTNQPQTNQPQSNQPPSNQPQTNQPQSNQATENNNQPQQNKSLFSTNTQQGTNGTSLFASSTIGTTGMGSTTGASKPAFGGGLFSQQTGNKSNTTSSGLNFGNLSKKEETKTDTTSSTTNQEKAAENKPAFSFGATTGSTTGSATGATTGATIGLTTGATTGSTTGSTIGATTGATIGSTTGSMFSFGAKKPETTSTDNTDKSSNDKATGANQSQTETKSLFGKSSEGGSSNISFGGTSKPSGGLSFGSLGGAKSGDSTQGAQGTSTSASTTENKPISFGTGAGITGLGGVKSDTSVKPNELFSKNLTKPEEKKEETAKISLTGKDNKEVKPAEPKAQPKKDVDEAALNSVMKKSIEDVINHWKNDLDNQVDRFENSAESLKHFEIVFLKNFETICSLNELINNLQSDGHKTIRTLEDISSEEDQIIDQLNIMDKQLDEYLGNYQSLQNVDNKNIYNTALEISRTVDEVQKDIDEVNSKISEPMQMGKDDNLSVLSYEHPQLKENISLNKNEFTAILNSYYSSLRSIQFMEQNLESKIRQVEAEIKEKKLEKEREYSKYY